MTAADVSARSLGGPFFDDLRVGDRIEGVPAVTLTEGHAALHQAIVGDRLRLALDTSLCSRVIGTPGLLAHPALVCDVAIGQSTLITQRVIANLFYRGLLLWRAPLIGDTLSTTTEVVALRRNSIKAGRAPTGLAVLRVRTCDQMGRRVLDFWRCAMLPVRDGEQFDGRVDQLDAFPAELDTDALHGLVSGWRLDAFREAVPGPHFTDLVDGTKWRLEGGDVVSAAPELARLSLNIATAHLDRTAGSNGRRLVYGGHTIGIAAAQATRALPNLVTFAGWHGCDHLAPVYEGDTLYSELALESRESLANGGGLVHMHSRVAAVRADDTREDVLDWRFVGVMA